MRDVADMDPGMLLIRSQRGMISLIAAELGIRQSAVSMWERVPAERLIEVWRVTKIPRYVLRPDIYPPPKRRSVRWKRQELCGTPG